MSLTIDNLYRAREFVNLKNISPNHIQLAFKNPVLAILAKGKINEIAQQCGPNGIFQTCELKGQDLTLTFDPEIVNERLLAEVFDAPDDKAQQAALNLSEDIAKRMKA